MDSKYSTNGSLAQTQGIALTDWMLVISIAGVLIYLAILTYRASVKDPAMSRRFSQVFGVMACRARCSTPPADALASLRWGRRACIRSLRRTQAQATAIADLAVVICQDNNSSVNYTQHETLLEPELAFNRGVTVIKTTIKNMLLQYGWAPDRPEVACCNRGARS